MNDIKLAISASGGLIPTAGRQAELFLSSLPPPLQAQARAKLSRRSLAALSRSQAARPAAPDSRKLTITASDSSGETEVTLDESGCPDDLLDLIDAIFACAGSDPNTA